MAKRDFEEIAMGIVGLFVVVALVSSLSPQLGSLMTGIFFLMVIIVLVAIVIKVIDFFNKYF